MTRLLMFVSLLGLVGCDSASDASCADCQTSFSTAECDSLGKSQGCESGEAVVDKSFCQGANVQSCLFHGCPTGKAILCQASGDAGTD